MITRAFDLREHDNGRLEARYFTYNSNGDVAAEESIPIAGLIGRLGELFPLNTQPPVDNDHVAPGAAPFDMTAGTPAGDETGVKDENPKLSGHLPDGFPGKAALEEAGHNTYHKVRGLIKAGTLQEVEGIGPETATKIEAALE